MAKVEFSDGIKKDISNILLTSLIDNSWGGGGYSDRIRFMKGTIPTYFPNYDTLTFRTSDILVDWNHLATVTNDSVTTSAAAASQSGAVSWFIFFRENAWTPVIIGTVGLTGSGADIELANTNIVQGTTYSISNLRISFPTEFTYAQDTTTTTQAPTTTAAPITTTPAPDAGGDGAVVDAAYDTGGDGGGDGVGGVGSDGAVVDAAYDAAVDAGGDVAGGDGAVVDAAYDAGSDSSAPTTTQYYTQPPMTTPYYTQPPMTTPYYTQPPPTTQYYTQPPMTTQYYTQPPTTQSPTTTTEPVLGGDGGGDSGGGY